MICSLARRHQRSSHHGQLVLSGARDMSGERVKGSLPQVAEAFAQVSATVEHRFACRAGSGNVCSTEFTSVVNPYAIALGVPLAGK